MSCLAHNRAIVQYYNRAIVQSHNRALRRFGGFDPASGRI